MQKYHLDTQPIAPLASWHACDLRPYKEGSSRQFERLGTVSVCQGFFDGLLSDDPFVKEGSQK